MSKHSSNPPISSEEVQRIIDERLDIVMRKEAAESLKETASSAPNKRTLAFFFRWLCKN